MALSGYLKAVWPDIFGPFFNGFSAEADPRDPPRSPGPAPHINLHKKSAPQANSKAISGTLVMPSLAMFDFPKEAKTCDGGGL